MALVRWASWRSRSQIGSACHYWNPGPVQVVMKLMLLISVKLYNSSIESS